jgi:hypothetical protein
VPPSDGDRLARRGGDPSDGDWLRSQPKRGRKSSGVVVLGGVGVEGEGAGKVKRGDGCRGGGGVK